MKKKTKKLLAFVVSSILTVLMLATLVNAAPYSYGEGISGGTTTFDKYLVMPKETNVPNKTFTFAISVPTAVVAGDKDNMPIYPGLSPNYVTIGTAAFVSADTPEGGKADDGITNDVAKKYIKKTVTVDLSAVKFQEPGVYRYYITENPADGCSPVTGIERTLDVNVINDTSATPANPLKVDSYVLYRGHLTTRQSKTDVQSAAKKPALVTADGDKCDSFINKYPSQNLYVGKKVEGNQGSKDKYFKFNVSITGLDEGTVIDVDLSHATSSKITNGINPATSGLPEDGYNNPNELTAGADGRISAVFWLQNDEFINLLGIPDGASYEVEEESYTDDGYVSAATGTTNTFSITYKDGDEQDVSLTFDDPASGTIDTATSSEDICTGFKNTKEGLIPTGVILSVAPWVIAGIVIIAGVVFFAIRSRKKYEE